MHVDTWVSRRSKRQKDCRFRTRLAMARCAASLSNAMTSNSLGGAGCEAQFDGDAVAAQCGGVAEVFVAEDVLRSVAKPYTGSLPPWGQTLIRLTLAPSDRSAQQSAATTSSCESRDSTALWSAVLE